MSDRVYSQVADSDAGDAIDWRRRLWIVDLLVVALFAGWSAIRASAGFEPTDVFPRLLLLAWVGAIRPTVRQPKGARSLPTSTHRLRVWITVVGGAFAVTAFQIFYVRLALTDDQSGGWPLVDGCLFIGMSLSCLALWGARRVIGQEPSRSLALPLFGLYLSIATATAATLIASSPVGRDLARLQVSTTIADTRVIARFVLGQPDRIEGREALPAPTN